LAVEPHQEIAAFHILGFFGEHLRHHAGRVGIDRNEIAGDEGVVGLYLVAAFGRPISRKIKPSRQGGRGDAGQSDVSADANLFSVKRHCSVDPARSKNYPHIAGLSR
jgi:hypothetical protein